MRKNNIKLRILFFMLLSIVMINTNAQTGLNFQGVARTTNNVILVSQAITIKLSILQGSSTGTADYTETRKVITNAQGLFTAVIGDTGAISTLGNFTNINWKLSPKFLKIEMDAAAGTNFITMGTTQFQYVAYAQFAKSVDAENIVGIVPVTLGGTGVASIASLKTALTLNNVNNTTDLAKPISTLTQTVLDLKLNAADTSKYTKQTYSDSALVAKQVLIGLKLNAADTSKYTKQTYADSSLLTKLKISDTAVMLSSRIARDTLSLSNRINLNANATDVTTGLALKENISNKSTAVDLGGTTPSDVLFPTQKAVKDYVAANNAGGGVADGGITTIKIADAAVTDAKINTVSGSKVVGNITGNAATATLATNATTAGNITATSNTTLTTLENLTSVGTLANLTVTNPIAGSITGNAATATTATTAGTATTTTGNAGTATKLATARTINGVSFDGSENINITASSDAGTLTGTTLNATVTGSSLTSVGILANLTVTNPIAGSITGNAATATTAGTATTTTGNAGTATKLATARTINGVAFDGSENITITSTSDAGTLTGTTLNATVTGSSLTSVGTLANLTVTNAIVGSITGNAATATTATTAGTATTTTGNAGTATKLATARSINGVAFDGTGDITITSTADAGTLTGTTLNSTITSSSLTSVGTITSGVWSGTAVAVEKGGTGATSASAARVNLGLEIGANVQAPLTAGTSYIVPNASITGATNTKLTYDAKGLVTAGVDATTADIAVSTNKNYVTDAQSGVLSNTSGTNTGDQTITLTGDVTATGTGTFTSTLANSGVSANSYGSSTSIPTFTVDAKGRLTTASTASIIADAGTLTGTALNATVTGSSLTSVGTLANLTVTNPIAGSITGNAATATLAATATTAGNITATTNTTLTTLSNLTTVGTITSGVWSGTAVAVEKGGTGLISAGTNGQVLTSTGSGTLTWTGTHYIGESYGGGKVFYVYDNGKHGLVAATSDQGAAMRWFGSNTTTRARADGVGAGLKNTAIIIAVQSGIFSPTYDGNAFAATVCNEYSVTVDGVTYGDWYLPSMHELNLLYLQKGTVGGFVDDFNSESNFYWSSTEDDNTFAWGQSFYRGYQGNVEKDFPGYVRAIRAF